jgi:hypothetical protein
MQIHGTGCAFQTVGPAEGLLELSARRLHCGLADHRQQRANLFDMIPVLDLKRSQ